MRIYLVRHGESVCNVQRMLYGRTDCALTELGCRQARAVGEKLRAEHIDRCVSSPLIRASETARLALWERETPIELDDGLMEQDMGEWENQPFDEMMQRQPELLNAMLYDWTKVVPPGGESYEHLKARVQVVLEREIERGGDVLLVAHNGPLSTAMSILMDMPDTAVNRLWFEQGTWSCVEIDHGVARLKYFNK